MKTAADSDRYFLSFGSIHFPVPIILREDLEAAGWIANVGVNPQ